MPISSSNAMGLNKRPKTVPNKFENKQEVSKSCLLEIFQHHNVLIFYFLSFGFCYEKTISEQFYENSAKHVLK